MCVTKYTLTKQPTIAKKNTNKIVMLINNALGFQGIEGMFIKVPSNQFE